jgi:hypothetical protein
MMANIKKSSVENQKILRRYTDLTAAIDILTKRHITLLDPASWDDRNDSYFLKYYKEDGEYKSVLALCMSKIGETYHHWRVFCGHASGVCIEFYKKPLLDDVRGVDGIRHGSVKYMTLKHIADKPPALKRLPFVKRYAYRHELEYRLIYESKTHEERAHSVAINLASVRGVTLSPWMPPPLLAATRELLHAIPGCESLAVSRSQLIENDRWMENAELALRGKPMLVAEDEAKSE